MKHKCIQCGYEWEGRIVNPKQCPRCKRYDWNMNIEQIFKEAKRRIRKERKELKKEGLLK